MKKNVLLLVVAIFMVICPLMSQNDYKQLYEKKIHSFTKLRNSGYTMAGVGGGLVIAGTVLMATIPDWYWEYDYAYDETDPTDYTGQLLGGIICATIGVGLFAGGITMGSIGSHKVRAYKKKLANLSVGVICTPHKQGLMLTYRF
jgi:hypothetical protein